MLARFNWYGAAVLAVLMSGLVLTDRAGADDVVARYRAAQRGNIAGIPRMVIAVETMGSNRRPMNMAVPNKDDTKPNYDPREDQVSVIRGLKPGDLVKITYAMSSNTALIQTIVAYPGKPGEEEPNAFVFHESYDRKEGKQTYTFVDLRQFEQPVTVMVPNKKDEQGDMSPDPQLQATVNKFKDGDVVLLDAVPAKPKPVIKSIELYTAPQTGKFIKSAEAEVDGNKTTSAEIEADGKTITAIVPGHLDGKKWVVDTRVLAEVKRLRPNSEVVFRAVDDGGKTVLRNIQLAPRQPASGHPTTPPKEKPAAPKEIKAG